MCVSLDASALPERADWPWSPSSSPWCRPELWPEARAGIQIPDFVLHAQTLPRRCHVLGLGCEGACDGRSLRSQHKACAVKAADGTRREHAQVTSHVLQRRVDTLHGARNLRTCKHAACRGLRAAACWLEAFRQEDACSQDRAEGAHPGCCVHAHAVATGTSGTTHARWEGHAQWKQHTGRPCMRPAACAQATGHRSLLQVPYERGGVHMSTQEGRTATSGEHPGHSPQAAGLLRCPRRHRHEHACACEGSVRTLQHKGCCLHASLA